MSRQITLEELRKHNRYAEERWLLIDGKVYNVTSYETIHPGGSYILQIFAARDATNAFNGTSHTSVARKKLQELYIGDFVGEFEEEKNPQADITVSEMAAHLFKEKQVQELVTSVLLEYGAETVGDLLVLEKEDWDEIKELPVSARKKLSKFISNVNVNKTFATEDDEEEE